MSLAVGLRPTASGWAVCLSNGQELVRYDGLFARSLALRYLRLYTQQMQRSL
jgi:hypothetical protein